MREEQILAATRIDSRTLTRRLREQGTVRGWLVPADRPLDQAKARTVSVDMQREVFERVAPSAIRRTDRM